MDNLCHTLVGAAFGEAGLKRRTRFGSATLMIASNLPDIDVLAFATGIPAALRRGWTHGAAQLLLPVALTAIVLAVDRRWPRTPARHGRGSTGLGGQRRRSSPVSSRTPDGSPQHACACRCSSSADGSTATCSSSSIRGCGCHWPGVVEARRRRPRRASRARQRRLRARDDGVAPRGARGDCQRPATGAGKAP